MNSRQYDDLIAQYNSTMVENDKLRADLASAREAVLDEVIDVLGGYAGYQHTAGIIARVDALRTTPADPELARLEREVARAAVASARAQALHDSARGHWPDQRPHPWPSDEWMATANNCNVHLNAYRTAKMAFANYIAGKREGGAK